MLIGASGQPGTFTESVVETMAKLHERPVIFALSNPTSRSECTAEQAYAWSGGRAVFASGSPFEPVTLDERTFVPGQANNVYVFPGVGLGVLVSGATRVTDEMFSEAARVLAAQASEEDLELGRVFPPLAQIRDVSARIASAVAEVAWTRGLTDRARPADVLAEVQAQMYEPVYPSYT